jgi:hypothetical protein
MSRIMFALGTALRETGQALDRVGCSMQGSSAFRELISKHKTVRAVYDKTPVLPSVGFVAPSAVRDGRRGDRRAELDLVRRRAARRRQLDCHRERDQRAGQRGYSRREDQRGRGL